MHRIFYPTFCCVCALCFISPATATPKVAKTEVLPLSSVAAVTTSTDWKQANQNVAELGGWQFYASEAGSHQGMDHSKHAMPMDHSSHGKAMDHSKHSMPVDHSSHGKAMDHSKHSMPMDHSSHGKAMDHSKHSMPKDHSKHSTPQQVKKGDEHELHH